VTQKIPRAIRATHLPIFGECEGYAARNATTLKGISSLKLDCDPLGRSFFNGLADALSIGRDLEGRLGAMWATRSCWPRRAGRCSGGELRPRPRPRR